MWLEILDRLEKLADQVLQDDDNAAPPSKLQCSGTRANVCGAHHLPIRSEPASTAFPAAVTSHLPDGADKAPMPPTASSATSPGIASPDSLPDPEGPDVPHAADPSNTFGRDFEALYADAKRSDPLEREEKIRSLLEMAIKCDTSTRTQVNSDRTQRDSIIKKKLFKAGYEYEVDRLLDLTSLMTPLTFRNYSAIMLRGRRTGRIIRPALKLPRVEGKFDLNVYFADRTLRTREAMTENKSKLLPKTTPGSSPASRRAHSRSTNSSRDDWNLKRQATAHALDAQSNDDDAGALDEELERKLALADSFVLPELGREKQVGFTRKFIAMSTGLSFFPIDQISMLAVNDFLRSPVLMISCYLEWASAMKRLAQSGNLSLSACKVLNEVLCAHHHCAFLPTERCISCPSRQLHAPRIPTQTADLIAQTPAACLDYFDAEYTKVDDDAEYAGFPLSGHMLANFMVLDRKRPEYEHLPLIVTKPLGSIQVALKHELRSFLAQPVVHSFMRTMWNGGSYLKLVNSPPEALWKVVAPWILFWWLILPYNLVVLLISATFPPFEQ